ncbi:MAG: phosphoglyceromutase [Thiotrichales bacterium SG8_50]|nr:MAG: phosphoglyceromutase [Thiotrichales bacterium SG8_50]
MNRLVLLRHGQSTWNLENRFTGWTDVDLSAQGIREARSAGMLLKREGFSFDLAFTSVLTRAIRTLWLLQEAMDLMWLPITKDWRLNERHYGALQGLNKAEIAEHYGAEQVHIWRRSFSVQPPSMSYTDPRLPTHDPRYANLDPYALPTTESLAQTMERALACWNEVIVPQIQAGKRAVVVAHGNTLRGLVKHLEAISDEAIAGVNIPTGVPLVYEFGDQMEVLTRYYLDGTEAVPAELAFASA